MTQTIDQALVTQFSSEVITRAQQMTSRFRGKVKEIFVRGNDHAVERLDKVGSIEVTTRHADTIAQDITHDRRQLKMREFRSTILLDEFDDLQVLIDPQREYSKHVAAELMRNFDRVVAQAAFADVKTGRNFGSTLSFANDDGLTVVTGGVGLTYEKFLELNQNFINNDVGTEEEEQMYLAITGYQNTDAMKETELTSGDFRRDYTVEKGKVTTAAGFDLIHFSGTATPPVLTKTSTTRDCIAFTPNGLLVGINKDITLTVNQRPDKNNAIQVQACMFMNAVRLDGKRVQKVQCTES